MTTIQKRKKELRSQMKGKTSKGFLKTRRRELRKLGQQQDSFN